MVDGARMATEIAQFLARNERKGNRVNMKLELISVFLGKKLHMYVVPTPHNTWTRKLLGVFFLLKNKKSILIYHASAHKYKILA